MTDSLRERIQKAINRCLLGVVYEGDRICDAVLAVIQPMFDGLHAQMDMVKRQLNEKLDAMTAEMERLTCAHCANTGYIQYKSGTGVATDPCPCQYCDLGDSLREREALQAKLDAMTMERDRIAELNDQHIRQLFRTDCKLDTAVKALRDLKGLSEHFNMPAIIHAAQDALAKIDTDTKGTT